MLKTLHKWFLCLVILFCGVILLIQPAWIKGYSYILVIFLAISINNLIQLNQEENNKTKEIKNLNLEQNNN